MNYFITGTDTNVGKTYVARLLIETLRADGIDAVGYKPVASGDRSDAETLAAASGGLPVDEVNPVHFQNALAPAVAAMLENRTVDPRVLIDGYRRLAARHQSVVVEGAGGWEVPIADGYHVSDLASDLGLPVIIVAANRLGCLNHILLTASAIRRKGLDCAGIYLNQLEDEMDTAMITNKGMVEQLSGLVLIDHIIHHQDLINPPS